MRKRGRQADRQTETDGRERNRTAQYIFFKKLFSKLYRALTVAVAIDVKQR